MTIHQGASPPANWYADPWQFGQLRFWDGYAWTPHVAPSVPVANHSSNTSHGAVELSHPQSEADFNDLSLNQPGQAARVKALELRRAHPFLTRLAPLLGVKTDERNWRVGADGEEEVGRQLSRLGAGWYVIHAVPIGNRGSDIDHVVIGPSGVYVLNTKTHLDSSIWVAKRSFQINGQKTHYLRNSLFEADRTSKLLSAVCGFPVQAHAVIVVLAATLTIKDQPQGVHVVARREIATWLSQNPRVLDHETVETIYAVARRDTTWQPPTGARSEDP